MLYDAIQPPFAHKFCEMEKDELRGYFRWYIKMLPDGVAELSSAVRQTPGYEIWKPDLSPKSLDLLGEWFYRNVATRQRSYHEIEEIRYRSPYPFDIPERELTDQTFSFVVNISMYVSCSLLHNRPSLKWLHPLGSKKYVHYGQPVLVEFTYGAFNPVHMMVTMAYAFADNTWSSRTLREVYDLWSAEVKACSVDARNVK